MTETCGLRLQVPKYGDITARTTYDSFHKVGGPFCGCPSNGSSHGSLYMLFEAHIWAPDFHSKPTPNCESWPWLLSLACEVACFKGQTQYQSAEIIISCRILTLKPLRSLYTIPSQQILQPIWSRPTPNPEKYSFGNQKPQVESIYLQTRSTPKPV